MKVVALVVAAIVVASAAAACGDAYDEDTRPADAGSGGTTDGTAADAASDATTTDAASPPAPRPPSPCPASQCPNSSALCDDESCTDPTNGDFARTGTTSAEMGQCIVSASGAGSSSFHMTQPHTGAREHITLALRLDALDTSDRVIASVSGEGEVWLLRARSGMLELCEENAAGLRCAPPIAQAPPGRTLHLYGISSPTSPPGASFALSVDDVCSPVRVLDATAPFKGIELRGTVGCLAGTAPCTMRFDDALFAVIPE